MSDKEEIEGCTCGLSEKEVLTVQDRLQELEDIRREVVIMTNGARTYLDKQKADLNSKGLSIAYQQGGLDAWEVASNILQGLTMFNSIFEDAQKAVRKERADVETYVG